MNQTQPSGSPQLGVGEVRNPQGREGSEGKGLQARAPAGPWTAPSVHAQQDSPPFENL